MDVEKPRAETPRDAKEPADEDLYTRLKELQRELAAAAGAASCEPTTHPAHEVM